MGKRDSLGHLTADDQPADQPRSSACGHAAKIGETDPGLLHYPTNLLRQIGQVCAGGDLRHDTAIGRMFLFLAPHGGGQDVPIFVKNGGGGLIAGGFNAEHRAYQYISHVFLDQSA
jgi:hypothetical protein